MPARNTIIQTSQGAFYRRDFEAQVVNMRDLGMTLQGIADHFGIATRQQVRSYWISGLRRAGRGNEVQSRELRVSINGQQVTVVSNDLDGTFEFSDAVTWTTFGAELECMTIGQTGACRVLRNASLNAEVVGYGHQTVSYWKATSDGSITGSGAVEAVSPVLFGNDGLRELRTAMMALREGGARVNASCGGHIHTGVDGWLTHAEQVKVIRNWWMINRAIEMLVLPRRRNHPRWCKRMTQSQCERYADVFENGVRNYFDRYYDLNVASFSAYGTFENRLHQGTLNGKNHTAWVILTQAVMRFLADATQEQLEALWSLNADESYGPLSIAVGPANATDGQCRRALERLLEVLEAERLIKSEVRTYLIGRAEWIARRGSRNTSSQAV